MPAGGVTRSVGAGSFFYKTVDINNLRGNAVPWPTRGVEEELAATARRLGYSGLQQSGASITARSSRRRWRPCAPSSQQELNKAQAREAERAPGQAKPGHPSPEVIHAYPSTPA